MLGAAIVLAGILVAGPLLAADPFYLDLLAEGSLAAERGDTAEAARKLRIACFGFLEEPALLAECQARLAIVQARRGDRRGFEQSFGRVLELERRFGAYAAAALPEPARLAFEEVVLARIPAKALADVPVFAAALRRQTVARLASLPLTERRRELEALAAAEPANPEWPLALAVQAVGERNAFLAREWLDRAGSLAPEDPLSRCLRGRVAAMAADCATAVAELPSCTEPPSGVLEAAEQLACWAASGDLEAADAFLVELPSALREARPVRKLGREIGRARQAQAATAASVLTAPPPTETIATPAGGGSAPAPAPPTPDVELYELRQALRRSRDHAAISGVCDRLARLADAHPGWLDAQRVAGEAAYRASRWSEAVRLLERGDLEDGAPPPLLFYYAVALYESGLPAEAAAALERALPGLERTPLVEAYSQRILPPAG